MVELMVNSELISLDIFLNSLLDTLARQKQRAFPFIIRFVSFYSCLVTFNVW